MEKKIIAFVGLPGSGKSEAVQFVQAEHGWERIYMGQITLDEVRRRGLAITPENEKAVREDLRAQFGKDHYAQEVVRRINEEMHNAQYVIIDGLYSWSEYKVFREAFGVHLSVVAIYASPQVRHARLATRPERPLTEEQARTRDHSEIENLEKGGPIAMADFTIINMTDKNCLESDVEKVVQKIL